MDVLVLSDEDGMEGVTPKAGQEGYKAGIISDASSVLDDFRAFYLIHLRPFVVDA